jgi:hypothetical protein
MRRYTLSSTLLILALCATIVFGDVYLHTPRGANNRLVCCQQELF